MAYGPVYSGEQRYGRASRPRYNGQDKSIQRGRPSLDAFVYDSYLKKGMTIPRTVFIILKTVWIDYFCPFVGWLNLAAIFT